ncbi:unnamed protein product [Arabidopsis arenosa]|uniref:TIR domain-containing protein n=1 Tax=Arabidopsis arenosa TaxID=38785 RepID=A0A8S2AL53_ARAAE|nr:unnamed protein product [Arabidopsis arenosa]
MEFRNPQAAQNSRVNIIYKGTVDSFVSHLFAALRREGISVFMDRDGHKNSWTSNDENHAISVVVISNIVEANDPWSHMFIEVIKPRRDNGIRIMVPYYGFDSFNLAWGKRRSEAGILTIHKSRISSNKILTDSELVEEIVTDVYGKLYPAERVGIYSKLLEIENLIYKQPYDVRSIGIWGIPGIGKTTLAKAVFNHMSTDYDASCFIENFDEAFRKDGLHRLLEQKLGLNEQEALQLFSQNAFGNDVPEQDDKELSKKVIDYANGNPLALSIYGQELKGKKSEMEATFLGLKKCPPQKIQDVLKKVYSALDDNEKNIVLDIAFFFKGENVNYVVKFLEGCRYLPRIGIDVLVDKCVLTISENTVQMNNLFQDICQIIFSRETESSTRMFEPNSIRYLLEDDDLKASGESSASPKYGLVVEDIESIILDTSNLKFDVKHDAFKNMFNLRFLKIYSSCSKDVHGLNFPKGLDSLPCGLRLLHWENYPLQSLPQDLDLDNLVELSMPYSQLQTLGAGTKNLKMLKKIRLCHSQQLVEFEIPFKAQNIEIIDLQGCKRLQNFPVTSQLQHLRVVNLSGCTEIIGFQGAPPNIEELHLQGTSIREIPISIVSHSPQKVKLDRQKLLNLLENFQDVEHIDLESVTDLVKVSSNNQGFGKLVHLNMRDCSHLTSLPDMVNLESLQVLHLSGCSELKEIKGFPRNIRKLYLGGTAIVEVPQLPKNLEFLNAHGCAYLKSVCLDFEQLPRHYTFSNCFNFSSQVISEFLEKGLTRISSLARAHQQEVIKAPEVIICIPADARQRSSFLLQEGSNVRTNLSHSTRKALSGFAMSVAVSFQDDYHNTVGLGIRCICTWKGMFDSVDKIERIYQCWAPREAPKVEWDHIFIFYDTQMHPSCSEVDFIFHTVSWENELLGDNCRVIQCDVQVITAATDHDTSLRGITRESEEATSIIEEHPPSSSRVVEPQSRLLSSNESSRKVSRASSKLSSKGTLLWKWVGPLVRKIRRNKKKTLRDRQENDPNMSTN